MERNKKIGEEISEMKTKRTTQIINEEKVLQKVKQY
jgi:hypothetical protein